MLYKSEMVMITRGISPPLAVPCRVRPTMSIFILVDRAHRIELAKKKATAVRSISFLPQMSDNFAQTGEAAVFASKYAPPIHV